MTEPGFNTEALRLPANSDIKAEKASRRHVERAQRLDVFALFLSRNAIPQADYDAVRRLEVDMHIGAGVANTQEPGQPSSGGCRELVSQRMIDATRRVNAVLDEMPNGHGKVVAEMLSPNTQGGVLTRWRGVVQRITGKRDKDGQADVIRWAAASVAAAYQALDYGERRRA